MNQVIAASAPDLVFEPLAPEFVADPYAQYARFRAQAPVFRTPAGEWFLTRYDDVSFVLRDRRFVRDFRKGRRAEMLNEPVNVAMSRMLPYLNPPAHTRVRRVVAAGFQPRQVEALRPAIERIAEELIARVESHGRMDLVADFALPLPLIVICELIGIPADDRPLFLDHSLRSDGRALGGEPMTQEELDRANRRTRLLQEYFARLLELRRRVPRDDLATRLVQAETAEEPIGLQELIANLIFLFGAGHETTANLIGNSLVALHQHRDQLTRVKAEPSWLARGIDELVRYGASIQFVARTAAEDVTVGGQQMGQGDIVIASLGAANRDPAIFPDPERLDLSRSEVRPLSFSAGIHYCVGAQLARLELEVALATLLRRLPDLRLADIDHLAWKPSSVLRGLDTLPATW